MKADARVRKIMLRRSRHAALVSAGVEHAFDALRQLLHPEVLAWAIGHAAKQQALLETCASLPTRLWSCSSLGERAQRTYETRRREDATANRRVRALLAPREQ